MRLSPHWRALTTLTMTRLIDGRLELISLWLSSTYRVAWRSWQCDRGSELGLAWDPLCSPPVRSQDGSGLATRARPSSHPPTASGGMPRREVCIFGAYLRTSIGD